MVHLLLKMTSVTNLCGHRKWPLEIVVWNKSLGQHFGSTWLKTIGSVENGFANIGGHPMVVRHKTVKLLAAIHNKMVCGSRRSSVQHVVLDCHEITQQYGIHAVAYHDGFDSVEYRSMRLIHRSNLLWLPNRTFAKFKWVKFCTRHWRNRIQHDSWRMSLGCDQNDWHCRFLCKIDSVYFCVSSAYYKNACRLERERLVAQTAQSTIPWMLYSFDNRDPHGSGPDVDSDCDSWLSVDEWNWKRQTYRINVFRMWTQSPVMMNLLLFR